MTELPPRPKSRFGVEEWEWENRKKKIILDDTVDVVEGLTTEGESTNVKYMKNYI